MHRHSVGDQTGARREIAILGRVVSAKPAVIESSNAERVTAQAVRATEREVVAIQTVRAESDTRGMLQSRRGNCEGSDIDYAAGGIAVKCCEGCTDDLD
jgi:hypothetical protein